MDISESTWSSEGWSHQQLMHLNSFNHKFWIICFSNSKFHYVLLGFFVNLNESKHTCKCVFVFFYLLHTGSQNSHSISKVRTSLESGDILGKWGHFCPFSEIEKIVWGSKLGLTFEVRTGSSSEFVGMVRVSLGDGHLLSMKVTKKIATWGYFCHLSIYLISISSICSFVPTEGEITHKGGFPIWGNCPGQVLWVFGGSHCSRAPQHPTTQA